MGNVASLELNPSFVETFPPYPKGVGLGSAVALPELVFVGHTTRKEQRALYNLASRGGESLVFQSTSREFREHLSSDTAEAPRCVVLDMESPRALQFVAWMRGSYRYCMVPIIGLVTEISSVSFKQAFAAGVDEVVPRQDLKAIIRRAQTVLRAKKMQTPMPQLMRRALIVTPSVLKRQMLGRVLRVAGFTLTFAETHADAAKQLRDAKPDLVVLHSDDHVNGWSFVDEVRSLSQDNLPVILVAPPRGQRGARPARAAIIAVDAPAEDLLFTVNELMLTEQKLGRASSRLLFGAVCSYQSPENGEEHFGFTYNVSGGGLYIRTMAPPAAKSHLWLSVTPPFAENPVLLFVEVMWTRSYGANIGGASPVGFGVRIMETHTHPTDLANYRDGYLQLAESLNTLTDDAARQGSYMLPPGRTEPAPPPER